MKAHCKIHGAGGRHGGGLHGPSMGFPGERAVDQDFARSGKSPREGHRSSGGPRGSAFDGSCFGGWPVGTRALGLHGRLASAAGRSIGWSAGAHDDRACSWSQRRAEMRAWKSGGSQTGPSGSCGGLLRTPRTRLQRVSPTCAAASLAGCIDGRRANSIGAVVGGSMSKSLLHRPRLGATIFYSEQFGHGRISSPPAVRVRRIRPWARPESNPGECAARSHSALTAWDMRKIEVLPHRHPAAGGQDAVAELFSPGLAGLQRPVCVRPVSST